MRGLNTDVDPTLLDKVPGGFAQFMNLTLRGGIVRPVSGDGAHSSPTFTETQLGTSDVSESFSINGTAGFQAYVARAGGTVLLRDSAGTTYPVALPSPTSAPTATSATLVPTGGLITGAAPIYTAVWSNAIGHGGLGAVGTLGPYALHVAFLSAATGAAPAGALDTGDTIAFGTMSGTGTGASFVQTGTAACVDSRVSGINTWYYLVAQDLSGTAASGYLATWGTAGTGTLAAAALPLDGNLYLSSSGRVSQTPPLGSITSSSGGTATVVHRLPLTTNGAVFLNGVTGSFNAGDTISWGTGTSCVWQRAPVPMGLVPTLTLAGTSGTASFYRLDSGGIYRGVSSTDQTDETSLLDADPYDGPLDANGFPADLVVPGTCQTLAQHKGCLFLAETNLLRWSEGMVTGQEVQWYREGYTLDCGGTVWALISRGEQLEVFTDQGIRYVVGNAPYFEIRDSQIHEPARARASVVGTDYGTFYLGADGLRLLKGGGSQLLSGEWNTTWLGAITTKSTCVGGASEGRYYLVDATGRCLVFDWEHQEWMERTFSALPSGFSWSATGGYLVAKVSGTYVAVESSASTEVDWTIQYPTRRGSKNRPLGSSFWLDNLGVLSIDVYVDGSLFRTLPVGDSTKGRIRLPRARGVASYLVLRGTGTPSTSAIRSIE